MEDIMKKMGKMEVTEEMVNHFREFCEAKETPYKKCPADARQKMETVDVPMITAKYNALWQQADANGDGFLNEAEWISYNQMMHQTALEVYGWAAQFDEDLMKKGYKAISSYTPDERGISREAMIPYMLCAKKIRKEMNI